MRELVGKVISGRYEVVELLGSGGMSTVYKVWDRERAVHLAMKVLQEDMAHDKVFLRRFQREAQTLAKLQHPYIVRFYGLEQEGELVFLLMDYIEGTTLKKEIFNSKGPFPLERILEILQPVCSALTYAHKKGFVHCDIKPANIMIKKNGEVLLTDFGIARLAEGATATMVGAGTPAYMAPEQILGKDPTPQTDIYALGIVLFEMLTSGERPFTGEQAKTTGSTAEKVRWEQLKLDPPSPRKYNKSISPRIEAAVMRCLAKDPAQRYPDVLTLVAALEQALGGVEKRELVDRKEFRPQSQSIAKKETKPQRQGVKLPLWALGAAALVIVIVWLGWKVLSTATRGGQVLSLFKPSPTASVTSTPQPTVTPTIKAFLEFEMIYIPAGTFEMGMDADKALEICREYLGDNYLRDWSIDEEPVREVYVSEYYIDKYEVTNGAYRQCVVDGVCNEPEERGSNTRENYYGNPEYAEYPVIYVSWYDAKTYCEWREARLPTEAEWEKAARGTAGNIFPWGNGSANCGLVNFNNCVGNTTEVGSYDAGASPYGVMDMAGNVWEWVSSLNEPYPYDPKDGREDLYASGSRVIRGGSWKHSGCRVRSSIRAWVDPSDTSSIAGFRCASSPSGIDQQ